MSVCPYLDGLEYCVFDIETTGFSAQSCTLISASFYYPGSGECFQLFCDEPGLEAALIKDCCARLSECDAVITYNGDSFDLPFMNRRAVASGAAPGLPFFKSLDIYKYLKRYWPAAKIMDSLSQRSMEAALGLSDERSDRIDGGECVELYKNWLRTGDEGIKNTILLHNGDDVRQLGRIFDSLNFLPWQIIAFYEGYPLRLPENSADLLSAASETGAYKKAFVRECKIDGSCLSVRGIAQPGGISVSIYNENYEFEYSALSGVFKLKLPLIASDGILIADLQKLPVKEDNYAVYPGFGSGYLVLSSSGHVNALEANSLTRGMLDRLMR